MVSLGAAIGDVTPGFPCWGFGELFKEFQNLKLKAMGVEVIVARDVWVANVVNWIGQKPVEGFIVEVCIAGVANELVFLCDEMLFKFVQCCLNRIKTLIKSHGNPADTFRLSLQLNWIT